MTLTYDGSLTGLLSAVFEAFRRGEGAVDDIVPEDVHQPGLFATAASVPTDPAHAGRVLAGLARQSGATDVKPWLNRILLTEQAGVERLILHYVRRQMAAATDVREDAGDPALRQLLRLRQQMGREVHRMHAFVRFQETPDGLMVALVNPDFNCLPLLTDHFAARYPAMDWLIYDTKRQYGLRWDKTLRRADFITLDTTTAGHLRQLSADQLAPDEPAFQELWNAYFKAVDIPERRNQKLHLQHVPKRYWRYLTEK